MKVKIQTMLGDIVVRLYDETPSHRDNFVKLVKEGYYDGTLFHRVIKNFMIQGGDPDSKGAPAGKMLGMGGPDYTIKAEIKDGLMDWTDERIKTPKKFYEDSSLSKKAIKIDLWYPTGTPEPECVIAHDSILPVINFYHSRLLSAGLNIRKCKVCGKYFLAESLKYELCSEKCRKEQGKIKKREFDARAVENSYDRTYKNECHRWRNIIHRAEKSEDTSPETLSKMKSAFEDFKAEAL